MHFLWMDRGLGFLKGRPINLPPGFVRSDDLCPVGNWLRERLDKRFLELPLYDRTDRLHQEFHVAMDALFSQDITRVPQPIAARFNQVGDDLTRALEDWIALAKNHTTVMKRRN